MTLDTWTRRKTFVDFLILKFHNTQNNETVLFVEQTRLYVKTPNTNDINRPGISGYDGDGIIDISLELSSKTFPGVVDSFYFLFFAFAIHRVASTT